MGKASRVPFSERGGTLRGVLDLATGRYPSFLFGGSTGRLLPVFHLHEVTRAVLEPRLQFLAEHGYRTVTTDAIARLVRDGRHPGPFTVALCFDDARASLWTVAMPMLRKYNFCAITYAIPGRIVDANATRPTLDDGGPTAERADLSDRPFVTWPELRALQAGGLVDVQNHTYSHASVFCADQVTGFVRFNGYPLGVIASDATLYGPAVGIAALETAARAADRWIATAYADAEDTASVVEAAGRLRAQGVDGIIVLAPHERSLDAVVAAHADVPVEALHAGEGYQRQREGAALAVAHLWELGHRRIAHLAGPADWLEARARIDGVREALAARGTTGPMWTGDWTAVTAAVLAPDIAAAITRADGPSAVVAANDQMALGLIAGLRETGLDVPGDVSVIGFDDNPDAAFYRPSLTTVRIDLAGEARRVVAAVLGASVVPAAPPVVVPRASAAAPRGMLHP